VLFPQPALKNSQTTRNKSITRMGSSLTRAPLAAVLWDLDGTLIDTSSSSFVALLEILQELCQKHKIVSEITREQLLPLIASDTVGGDGKDGKVADGDGVKKKDKEGWAAEALALTGLDKKGVKPKALVDKWESAMITRRAQIPLLPGSIELVRHFKKAGIPQAIATMSSSRSVHVKRSNQVRPGGRREGGVKEVRPAIKRAGSCERRRPRCPRLGARSEPVASAHRMSTNGEC